MGQMVSAISALTMMAAAQASPTATLAALPALGPSTSASRPSAVPPVPGVAHSAKIAKAPVLLSPDITVTEFIRWRRVWTYYALLSCIDQCSPAIQRAALQSNITLTKQEVVHHNLAFDDNLEAPIDDVLDAIEAFFRSQSNVVLDRLAYQKRKQRQGEKFMSFLLDLKHL